MQRPLTYISEPSAEPVCYSLSVSGLGVIWVAGLLRVIFGGSLAGNVSSSCRLNSLSSSRLSRCSRVSLCFGIPRPPCWVSLAGLYDLTSESMTAARRALSGGSDLASSSAPYRFRAHSSGSASTAEKGHGDSLISKRARSSMAPWRRLRRRELQNALSRT
jgi:hypothetical protein